MMPGTNPYACPERLHEVMNSVDIGLLLANTPVLAAVRTLGPERCQYVSQKAPRGLSIPMTPVSWTLDGKPVTYREIMRESGLRA